TYRPDTRTDAPHPTRVTRAARGSHPGRHTLPGAGGTRLRAARRHRGARGSERPDRAGRHAAQRVQTAPGLARSIRPAYTAAASARTTSGSVHGGRWVSTT